MKTLTHKSGYKVGSGQIHMVITIGDGQFGSSSVIIGDTLFDQERLFDRDIGMGSELSGKKIVAVSVVTDTNEQTNHTSITYELSGGPAPYRHRSEFTVEQDNDSVKYVAEIELTS